MAATGKTPILLYGSTTATNVPVAGNLTNSSDGCEIAINVADKNLFFKDSTNAVNTVPIRQSSGSSDGWLSSANWTTFNSKQAAYTNLTSIGSLANAAGWLYNNGSGTFSYSTPSKSDVGLGNVTNDAQTKAAIVPNTAPTAGQILVGNAGGTAYAPVSMSGDATLSSTGAATLATVNSNVGSYTYANITVNAKGLITAASSGTAPVTSVTGTAPVVSSGGTTPAISMAAANGSTNGYLTSTDWTTFNGKAPAFTYTTGYIPFGQGTTTPNQDSALFWDNTNKRLGIGTTTPSTKLHVAGGAGSTIRNTASSGSCWFVGTNVDSYILHNESNTPMVFTTNGSERMRIFASGGVSIGNTTDPGATNLSVNGNVVIATSGKGIDFSATAGTGTSELLADYEEGTCTIGVAFGGGTTGITYAAQQTGYVKVGNIVTVTGYFTLSNKGSSTGNARLTGLPYTVGTSANGGYGALSLAFSYVSFAGQYSGYTIPGGTTAALYNTSEAGTLSALTNSNFANSSEIELCITYRAA